MKKIIILTALFAMVFTGAALAADWNFYGSARVRWFNVDQSAERSPITGKSFSNGQFGEQGNSRIGANVQAGDVGGRFEFGSARFASTLTIDPTETEDITLSAGEGIVKRLLYGTWNFGQGTLLVGQMYTPTYYGLSNQVADSDNGLAGFGAPFSRLDALELRFGGFKVALVESVNSSTWSNFDTPITPLLPKIEVAWNGNAGPVRLHLSGGWGKVEAKDSTTDATSDVTSYVAQIMGKYSTGPFMLGASFLYGQNVDNYGWNVAPANDWGAGYENNTVKDSTGYGFTLVAAWKFNDMVGVEGGYGYVTADSDLSTQPNSNSATSYYINVPITLADGVFIVPEYTKFDYSEDGTAAKTKRGDETYIGAKFQINF